MINPHRLSRIITSRECMSAVDRNLEMYDKLSVAQRLEIKNLLEKNKNGKSQYNK